MPSRQGQGTPGSVLLNALQGEAEMDQDLVADRDSPGPRGPDLATHGLNHRAPFMSAPWEQQAAPM
jgi:hypothetical protein